MHFSPVTRNILWIFCDTVELHYNDFLNNDIFDIMTCFQHFRST